MANKKPSIKQKRLAKELIENPRLSMRQAMIKAGFSENTASDPTNVTETKTWKELMAKYLPDEFIAKKHKQLFDQKQINYFVFPKTMSDEEIISHVKASGLNVIVVRESDKGKMAFYSIDDANAQKAGLDMAYKLKGSYAAEKKDVNISGVALKDLFAKRKAKK